MPKPKTRAVEKEFVRLVADYDLYTMAYAVLDRRRLRWNPNLEMCQFVERHDRTIDGTKVVTMVLAPRDSYKTTIMCARMIQSIVRDRDISFLLFGETDLNAKNKLQGEVREHLETNKVLIGIYGPFKGSGQWSVDRLYVAGRTRVSSQPTLAVAGINAPEVGEHYACCFINDPVSNLNTTTETQIQNTNRVLNLLEPIIEPGMDGKGGRILIDGTRWADGDYYGRILARDVKKRKAGYASRLNVYVRTAIKPDGTLYFPEKLHPEFLIDKLDALGPYDFFCQYMNDPYCDILREFKEDWLVLYKREVLTPEFLQKTTKFITIDPAYTDEREKVSKSDYTGVIVNAVDDNGHWWIIEAIRRRVDIGGLFDFIFEVNEAWEPDVIGLEQRTVLGELGTQIEKEAMYRGVAAPPVIPLHAQKRIAGLGGNPSKETRIKVALQNRFRRRIIHICEDQHDLLYEYRRFPKAEHDDLIDALSYQPRVIGDEDAYLTYDDEPRLDKTTDHGLIEFVSDWEREKQYKTVDMLGSEA